MTSSIRITSPKEDKYMSEFKKVFDAVAWNFPREKPIAELNVEDCGAYLKAEFQTNMPTYVAVDVIHKAGYKAQEFVLTDTVSVDFSKRWTGLYAG